jgi:molybdate transport system permease protein
LVSFPLVKESFLAGLLLALARASGEVGITLMLGGNVANKTNTLSLEVYNSVARGDFDTASQLCAVLAAFALVLYLLLYAVRSKKVF